MKRFAFRLERLLELRESAERERARELGIALRAEEDAREACRASQARLADAREQLAITPRELSQAGTRQNMELSLERLLGETRRLEAAHEQALERLESERRSYEQARTERKVLERLRTQRRETWGTELGRYEQGIDDETATQRGRPRDREGV